MAEINQVIDLLLTMRDDAKPDTLGWSIKDMAEFLDHVPVTHVSYIPGMLFKLGYMDRVKKGRKLYYTVREDSPNKNNGAEDEE